ncbi:hypothetical protein [uncultured Chryseobacterium sp.]|uniref:hypothetical protein n=1 Tax=uncultured Chryseobacterium sp. TaxID=259322 RepID=UPI0025F92FC1|nr:hypothetical protein [uncultured Chryseobacterium sp.]
MTEESKKAFDFAADTVKQLITLATGIIAITITFLKDILGSAIVSNSIFLFISWGLFIFSILFGIFALQALTGSLQPRRINTTVLNTPPNINTSNIRIQVGLQIVFFISALICTVIFGICSINKVTEKKGDREDIKSYRRTEYLKVEPQKIEKINYLEKAK